MLVVLKLLELRDVSAVIFTVEVGAGVLRACLRVRMVSGALSCAEGQRMIQNLCLSVRLLTINTVWTILSHLHYFLAARGCIGLHVGTRNWVVVEFSLLVEYSSSEIGVNVGVPALMLSITRQPRRHINAIVPHLFRLWSICE